MKKVSEIVLPIKVKVSIEINIIDSEEKKENTTTENSDVKETFHELKKNIETKIVNGIISISEARNLFNEKYPGTFSK